MTLIAIWTFISMNWHKIAAMIAFFFAAYNHYRHSRLLDKLLEQQLAPNKNKKHKRHHKNKNG